MTPPPYAAEPGHWFLRGVQSAIFYYISFTPCLEYQHKRKRRREAEAQAQAHNEIVTTQPGLVRQPGPFQTNETWAEELMLGPGPPKGWKADRLLQKLKKSESTEPPEVIGASKSPELPQLHAQATTSSARLSPILSHPSTVSSSSDTESHSTKPRDGPSGASLKRPSMDRRLSTAMENIKDSLKSTLHPDMWNWKRYDREDEVLWGFSERMTRMWNRATAGALHDEGGEAQARDEAFHPRRRAPTMESDRYDYRRGKNPALNDLHPPPVSQLPATRDDAAWMMLPPPSAAVMAGRKRPGTELEMRWPLAIIGRPMKANEPPSRPLAHTLSRDNFDCDSDEDVMDTHEMDYESDEQEVDDHEEPAHAVHALSLKRERPDSIKIKHLSDPIMRPMLAHTKAATMDDLSLLNRRSSWQVHYLISSDEST